MTLTVKQGELSESSSQGRGIKVKRPNREKGEVRQIGEAIAYLYPKERTPPAAGAASPERVLQP